MLLLAPFALHSSRELLFLYQQGTGGFHPSAGLLAGTTQNSEKEDIGVILVRYERIPDDVFPNKMILLLL